MGRKGGRVVLPPRREEEEEEEGREGGWGPAVASSWCEVRSSSLRSSDDLSC